LDWEEISILSQMEKFFGNNALKKTADLLRLRRDWFVSLIEKILLFLFKNLLLNDCEITELNPKKVVLRTSFLGVKNANKPDNFRIACGYGQKTVLFSLGGKGGVFNYVTLTYVTVVLKDYVQINLNKINKEIFSNKFTPPALLQNTA